MMRFHRLFAPLVLGLAGACHLSPAAAQSDPVAEHQRMLGNVFGRFPPSYLVNLAKMCHAGDRNACRQMQGIAPELEQRNRWMQANLARQEAMLNQQEARRQVMEQERQRAWNQERSQARISISGYLSEAEAARRAGNWSAYESNLSKARSLAKYYSDHR